MSSMTEREFLGNSDAGRVPRTPSTELEATRLEQEAELQLTLAVTAQQMGDWRKASIHNNRAHAVYSALLDGELLGVVPGAAPGVPS